MACNSCAKQFTLFRKEKGCPNCGFSFCSNCLNNQIFLKKINCEAKVCSKCKHSSETNKKKNIEPPEAYYKRIGVNKANLNDQYVETSSYMATKEIKKRLQVLKQDRKKDTTITNGDLMKRLQNIKGTLPSTSDAELQSRLANLKGLPVIENQNKTLVLVPDQRSEQEEVDELMKSYIDQVSIDKKYKDGFEKQIENIASRMDQLRAKAVSNDTINKANENQSDSEDEETAIKNIIEKAKADALFDVVDDSTPLSNNDELPFCEICNEDARMRCLGCRYLFCKACFLDHKDDGDGCNRYEPYEPPKAS